jgi:hypothetical protein
MEINCAIEKMLPSTNITITNKQCSGSVIFINGSGSSGRMPESVHWIRDPDLASDPDPALFVSWFQDANFFGLLLIAGTVLVKSSRQQVI